MGWRASRPRGAWKAGDIRIAELGAELDLECIVAGIIIAA